MEARLGEVKAGTETQFERLRGDIRELKASTASTATVIVTAIALFAALAGVIAAMAATGWQGFGVGISASDLANKAAERAVQLQKSKGA